MENKSQSNDESKGGIFELLRIYPEERKIFIFLGLVFFFNSVATQISSVVSVSGFLDDGGIKQIPVLWIIDMLVILLTGGLQSLIVDKFERSKIAQAMTIGFALVFAALWGMTYFHIPGGITYGLMMIISDQQWLFFPLVFWTLAQDIFSVAQTKRIFPVLSSLGLIGRLAGLSFVAVAPQILSGKIATEQLIFFNVVLYIAIYFLVVIGLRRVAVRKVSEQQGTTKEILVEGWDFVKNVPAFRYLVISMFAVNLALTFLEFGFLAVTHDYYVTNYQTFYSLYRLSLTIISFLLQTFLTSRIIDKLTLKNAFLLLPLSLVGGSLWMFVSGIVNTVGGFLLPKIVQFTAGDSARLSFQALVPEERRGRVSIFMESYLFAVGVVIASLLLLGAFAIEPWIGEAISVYIYQGLGVIASLWSVWGIIKMRDVYELSMLDWRLKRRQRTSNVLDKLDF